MIKKFIKQIIILIRKGGKENFTHCDQCGYCLNNDSFKFHKVSLEEKKNTDLFNGYGLQCIIK